jgi:transposase
MNRRHALTDDQWELIADIFGEPFSTGRPRADRRTVVDGIFWILRTGAPWRDLPERYGKWKTVYELFRTWSYDGTIDEILRRLRGAMVDVDEIDDGLWCVDGTNIRAARCAAGAKKGDPKNLLLATRH